MHTDTLRAASRALERAVIGLAVAALLFRATLYHVIGKPAGAAWGEADVLDYVLALALFVLCGACAACGVALTARASDAEKAAAHRPVLIGMTTFVAYYLVHPYVPALL